MKKVGFIGWRGMVGSVLMERMLEHEDFTKLAPSFFTTSQKGESYALTKQQNFVLKDAKDLSLLAEQDVLVSCQGGDYTTEIHPKLRAMGWKGFWIDAASTLRLSPDAMICLDPLNRADLARGIDKGVKDFIGGNCTVSLMLMAMGGLFKADLVEFVSSQTYQAASGGGALHMRELLQQMRLIGQSLENDLNNPQVGILEIDQKLNSILRDGELPTACFGQPLAGNLLPWIDSPMPSGQSREEWKAQVEANKILGRSENPIMIDGTCVRVSSMRCHSQALMVKLKKKTPLKQIEELISSHNPWVEVIDNTPDQTKAQLSPVYASGTLKIPVGRLRHLTMGEDYLNAFTVGDQLLWGAAEPLRLMLKQVLKV